MIFSFFFFTDPATTEIYTLSLHDALPIFVQVLLELDELVMEVAEAAAAGNGLVEHGTAAQDRKSTRLNSSHVEISYAVFCLKKKKKNQQQRVQTSQGSYLGAYRAPRMVRC